MLKFSKKTIAGVLAMTLACSVITVPVSATTYYINNQAYDSSDLSSVPFGYEYDVFSGDDVYGPSMFDDEVDKPGGLDADRVGDSDIYTTEVSVNLSQSDAINYLKSIGINTDKVATVDRKKARLMYKAVNDDGVEYTTNSASNTEANYTLNVKATNSWVVTCDRVKEFNPVSKKFISVKDIYTVYYVTDNKSLVNGSVTIDNVTYNFKNGKLVHNEFINTDNHRLMYLKANGQPATGFIKINGKRYYFDKSGYAMSGLYKRNNTVYYFGEDGCLTGQVSYDKYLANKEKYAQFKTHYVYTGGVEIVNEQKKGNTITVSFKGRPRTTYGYMTTNSPEATHTWVSATTTSAEIAQSLAFKMLGLALGASTSDAAETYAKVSENMKALEGKENITQFDYFDCFLYEYNTITTDAEGVATITVTVDDINNYGLEIFSDFDLTTCSVCTAQ